MIQALVDGHVNKVTSGVEPSLPEFIHCEPGKGAKIKIDPS